MIWARDIKADVITQCKDNTNGLNAQITKINTERTEATPLLVYIGDGTFDGQMPSAYIDLGDSTYESGRGRTYTDLIEVFSLIITVFNYGGDPIGLKTYSENYLEAVIRCLHNFKKETASGDFYLVAQRCIREEIDNVQGQTMKITGVEFECHRNEL